MTKRELENKCRELEIKCSVMEDHINRIYEASTQYPNKIDISTAIGKIRANSDPDFLAERIRWKL